MENILSIINSYSNLILVLVTVVYVILTGSMVVEMKRTRELQDDSSLVATLIPLGGDFAKMRIINVGSGPALNISATIKMFAETGDTLTTWIHPVLLAGKYEDFHLPGDTNSIKELAERLGKLNIELKWANLLNKSQSKNVVIDMRELQKGWFGSKFIIPVEDTPVQLQRIKDELSRLNDHLQKQETLRMFQNLDESASVEKKPIKKKRKSS